MNRNDVRNIFCGNITCSSIIQQNLCVPSKVLLMSVTPFTQLLPTRVCFTNAGVNTYGAEIHKVRKHAIYAFPWFLFLILLFRLYVKEPFSEM